MRAVAAMLTLAIAGPALAVDPQTKCKMMRLDAAGNSVVSDCSKAKEGTVDSFIREKNKRLPWIAESIQTGADRERVLEFLRREREKARPDPVVPQRPKREVGI